MVENGVAVGGPQAVTINVGGLMQPPPHWTARYSPMVPQEWTSFAAFESFSPDLRYHTIGGPEGLSWASSIPSSWQQARVSGFSADFTPEGWDKIRKYQFFIE